jgi:hypothetical protein
VNVYRLASTVALVSIVPFVAASCSPAASPSKLDGVYTTPDPGGAANIELRLDKGHYSITVVSPSIQDGLAEEGSFSVTGDQVKFTREKTGPMEACLAKDQSFTYRWSLDEKTKKLGFTVVADQCSIRAHANTVESWSPK